MTEENTPPTFIQRNPSVRAFLLILAISVPSLLFMTLMHCAETNLARNSYENLLRKSNYYYYYGWPVEEFRYELKSRNDPPNFITARRSSLTEYRDIDSRLNYEIDRSTIDAWGQLANLRLNASILYIDDISQPTDNLENLTQLVVEGIVNENHDLISYSLFETSTEIENLRAEQQDDLDLQIQHYYSAIKSIALLGEHYGLDLSKGLSTGEEIRDSNESSWAKYVQLRDKQQKLGAKLDSAIVARGGKRTHDKRIVVDISSQRLFMLEDYAIVRDMPVSTGIAGHNTAAGEFQVYDKVPMAWGYYHIWMPYWLTIYHVLGVDNGIHGIPVSPSSGRWSHWDNVVGEYPITYGCVMPHDWDAKILYEWAEVGTPVSIFP